jgi:superfamily I DNA and RNA helicase
MGQAMRGYAYFYLAQLYQKEYNAAEMILPIYTDTKFQISLKVLRLTFML